MAYPPNKVTETGVFMEPVLCLISLYLVKQVQLLKNMKYKNLLTMAKKHRGFGGELEVLSFD